MAEVIGYTTNTGRLVLKQQGIGLALFLVAQQQPLHLLGDLVELLGSGHGAGFPAIRCASVIVGVARA